MTTRIKLEPRNIREIWDRVKPGLEEIQENFPQVAPWRVEDVYAEVVNEKAVIYENEDGFAVCYIQDNKYMAPDFFIWIAYAYPDRRGGVLKKLLPSFQEIARELGCGRVVTVSASPELQHFAGMDRLYTTYAAGVQ